MRTGSATIAIACLATLLVSGANSACAETVEQRPQREAPYPNQRSSEISELLTEGSRASKLAERRQIHNELTLLRLDTRW
jgi:hypothetical protein